MTIQLSVTVWTVICFVLFALILHHLLFKPVLGVIDKRNEKIRSVNEKKAVYEAARSEYETTLAEKKAAASKEQQLQIKAEIEEIRSEGKKAVDTATENRLQLVDEFRENTEEEHQTILSEMNRHTDEIVALFADRLVKEN